MSGPDPLALPVDAAPPTECHDSHVGVYADHLRRQFHRGRTVGRVPPVLVRWRRDAIRWRWDGQAGGTDCNDHPLAVQIRERERAFRAEKALTQRPVQLAERATPKAAEARRAIGNATRASVLHWAAQPECQKANGKPIPKRIAEKAGISAVRVRSILSNSPTVLPDAGGTETLASETEQFQST